jgi:hypothetical protein
VSKGARRRFGFPQGDYGRLEFVAPACLFEVPGRTRPCEADFRCRARPNGCLARSRLFETISELLAESGANQPPAQSSQQSPAINRSPQCAEPSRSANVAKFFSLLGLALLFAGNACAAVGTIPAIITKAWRGYRLRNCRQLPLSWRDRRSPRARRVRGENHQTAIRSIRRPP